MPNDVKRDEKVNSDESSAKKSLEDALAEIRGTKDEPGNIVSAVSHANGQTRIKLSKAALADKALLPEPVDEQDWDAFEEKITARFEAGEIDKGEYEKAKRFASKGRVEQKVARRQREEAAKTARRRGEIDQLSKRASEIRRFHPEPLETPAQAIDRILTEAGVSDDKKEALRPIAHMSVLDWSSQKKGISDATGLGLGKLDGLRSKIKTTLADLLARTKRQNMLLGMKQQGFCPSDVFENRAAAIVKIVKLYNEEYFCGVMGGKPVVCRWAMDMDDPNEGIFEAMAPDAFKHIEHGWLVYYHEVDKDGYEQIICEHAAPLWLDSAQRMYFDGIVFEPDNCAATISRGNRQLINLWRGFTVTPEKGDGAGWKQFVAHIEKLTGGDKAQAKFLLRWLAYCFQQPAQIGRVMPILIGEQGSGKGTLFNLICSIFGRHALHVTSEQQLIGRFNWHLLDKLFIFLDEAMFSGDKKAADAIKPIITDAVLTYEKKFGDTRIGTNRLKIVASSNHDHALHIELGDRRYFAIRVPDEMAGDKAFLKKSNQLFEKAEVKAEILAHLLEIDLKGFDAERDRPKTDELAAQKRASLSGSDAFWDEVISTETWLVYSGMIGPAIVGAGSNTASSAGVQYYEKADIYRCYLDWHKAKGLRGRVEDKRLFWKKANKWAVVEEERLTIKGADDKQRRARCVGLYNFEVMQECFDAFISKGVEMDSHAIARKVMEEEADAFTGGE